MSSGPVFSWTPEDTDCTWEPKKYWNTYSAAKERPIVTTISWVSPSPRFRSGPQMNRSCRYPVAPPMMIATAAARMNGSPRTVPKR